MLRKFTLAVLACVALAGLGFAGQDDSAQTAPVDINSAPIDEIVEIVQDERVAERIVAGRPWANKRQLLTRDLVSEEEYERIRDLIVARRVQEAP